jgi:hypothetical protein
MVATLDITNVPKPVPIGPEMEALARFHVDASWKGTIYAGGMGPGSPAMIAFGKGTHMAIQEGRWIVGTYEQVQHLLDGTFVLRWALHWVAGWDPVSREYRATVADCYGHAEVLHGWIEGDRLTFESNDDSPVRIRLVWDFSDPRHLRWRNEVSADGGPWSLIEDYVLLPDPPAQSAPIAYAA